MPGLSPRELEVARGLTQSGASYPWYPLPPDYPDLTSEGQRLARVAAVSRNGTPEECVESWALFRALYLFPLPKGDFYTKGIHPSPAAHYEWVRDLAVNQRTLIAAPRGSAKSTAITRECSLRYALTNPYYRIQLVLGTDDLVEKLMGGLKLQLEENEHIRNDFGKQKSPKGTRIWNLHELWLPNGSAIGGISVRSGKRGLRPNMLILDDPEYNPDIDGVDTQLLKKLETLLFRELLPMLSEKDDRIMWIGTMVSRRSALWSAAMGDDDRFSYWARRVYSMVDINPETGAPVYFWPGRWGKQYVAQRRRELGVAAFQAECLNKPVSEQERTIRIHDAFNQYEIVGQKVIYREPGEQGEAIRYEDDYQKWLDGLSLVMTVDPTFTVSAHSDFAAALVTGVDSYRNWWILDLFLGRVVDTQFVEAIWKLGNKWRPSIVGVEAIGLQSLIMAHLDDAVERKGDAMEMLALSEGSSEFMTPWRPRVFPLSYPNKMSKPERIALLCPKFSRYQLRLPRHLRETYPMKVLYQQLQDFTPDLSLLTHDDAIDALAGVNFCPRPHHSRVQVDLDDMTIEEQFLAGRTTDRLTGIPLYACIGSHNVTPAMIAKMREQDWRKKNKPHEKTASEQLHQSACSLMIDPREQNAQDAAALRRLRNH